MDYFRVGGVCLLLIAIAVALPSGWAQSSQTTDNSVVKLSEKSVGGAAPVVSEDFFSRGSEQGESVSPQSLMKRSSGLKPALAQGSAANPQSTSAPEKTESTASAQESMAAGQEASGQTVQPTTNAAAETTPAPASTEPADSSDAGNIIPEESPVASAEEIQPAVAEAPAATPVTQNVITPDMIPQENLTPRPNQSVTLNTATEMANATSPGVVASQGILTSSENITPPENLTSSVNQTQNETATENETEEQPVTAVAEEPQEFTDRIWSEDRSPYQYSWGPMTFSGFFYDFKDNIGTERLDINLHKSGENASRAIDSGDLKYTSTAEDLDYKFDDWGSYQVIGFMADKYFAGYKANDVIDRDRSLLNEGQLRRVLIDSDAENTITSGSVLPLEEGYELRIKEIDLNGNKVYMALAKDGEEIDSKVVSPDGVKSSTYTYKVDVAGEDTPIIMAHISNVFASAETNLVTVDGLFQISDTYASVENGDKYGEMKVETVSDKTIEMENEDSLTLRKGRIVNIFGDMGFEVADADMLRFAPIVQRAGTFEVRGTVINPSETAEFTWTPYNFEGFFYDIDDDIGNESLNIKITGNSRVEDKDLKYETKPQPIKFEFDNWGKYDVIGFMADKYFAGYNDQTKFTDASSVISEGQLRKILIDSDTENTIATGSVLPLEEGYELRIKEVDLNGNKVYLALAKNGEEIDSKVVTPSSESDSSSNYMYKVSISSKDVPIIAAHVASVFRGTEADLATVDGLFQVSDTPASVEEGEVYEKMKVESVSDQGVTMQNDGSITLGRDKTIDIMDNIKFVVADNTMRNFAPVAEKTVGGKPLALNISEAIVNRTVIITVTSGKDVVSGAQVIVSGNNIGSTDDTGSIRYTPNKIGTLDVVAKKTGYNDAKGSMVVRSPAAAAEAAASANAANQLVVNAPSEITKGEPFVIAVVRGINQTPVEGAKVSVDNVTIGSTNAQGTLTYEFNHTSEHIISIEVDGNVTTRKITVNSPVKVQNITLPDKASAGQDIKITANLQNTGSEPEERSLDLKVNDKVVSSKNVSIKPGENYTTTFSYKPKDPGTYRISLDNQSRTINVEKGQQRNTALIALILILLIAIGAGVYLYKTGELEKLRRQLQGR